MPQGGKRKGAGRPQKPEDEKKVVLSCRLHPEIIDWIEAETERTGKKSGELISRAIEVLKEHPDRQFPDKPLEPD